MYVDVYAFNFIFYLANLPINFSQYFIFYFFIFTSIYFIKNYLYAIKINLVELPFILLFIFGFIYLLLFVNDLILVYFCLEGLGFATYIFFGLSYDKHMRYEGCLKYFILNSFASILFLFGTIFIYFATSNTSFTRVILILNQNFNLISFDESSIIILVGFLFILVGFLFKLGIFPCIIWIVDIYESLVLPIAFILLTLYKFILYLIFTNLLINVFFILNFFWQPILFLGAIGSLLIGSLGALIQYKLKRFIGYTSINQIGYVILGLSCGTQDSIIASYNFLIFYIIVNTIFFNFLFTNQFTTINKTNKTYSEFYYITDLSNIKIYLSNSIFSIFVFVIIAIIGLPPLTNFFIKYDLLVSFFINYQIPFFIFFIVILITVISSFYYIRLLKILFFNNLTITWSSIKIKQLQINCVNICISYLVIMYYYIYASLKDIIDYFFYLIYIPHDKLLVNNTLLSVIFKIKFNSLITSVLYNNYFNQLFIVIDFWTIALLLILL